MILSKKVRLYPTEQQEELMLKTIGCSRFAYNWALNRAYELYKQGCKYNINDIMKEFTKLKKEEEFKWLNEVSNTTMKEAMRNLDVAFKGFFKKKNKYPRFKSRRKSRQSFYVRYDALYFKGNVCNIEKIGKVKFKADFDIPNTKYSNPYCSFDGKYWMLTFGIEQEEIKEELTDVSLGIDLGLKELAVCSNGTVYKNINKSHTVKKTEKKLRRLQRQVSRKYEKNKKGKGFAKTNNIIKLEKRIRLVHRRLSNIRKNHLHQTTASIVKTKPYRVVVEDLNVKGMMKNKHLSNAIGKQGFYEFTRQLEYKCKFRGIELVVADRFYPSSKTCSQCGQIKKDLKLRDRTYKCDCGLCIDRDLNASINLSKYKLA